MRFFPRTRSAERRQLALLVPGLYSTEVMCARPSDVRARYVELERWRARGESAPLSHEGHDTLLCELFGITVPTGQDPPSASLSRIYDSDDSDSSDAYWLRADPVHLRADQGHLLMIGGDALRLDAATGAELLAEVNNHLFADGLRLQAPVATRWYLRTSEAPRIRTTPWQAILGEDVAAHLPDGPDAGRWRALLNEIQMILHAAEGNRRRVGRGELPVNSVWLWGGGRLPGRGQRGWDSVWSDDAVARGLAVYHGIHGLPMPRDAVSWWSAARGSRHLIVAEGVGDGVTFGDADARLAYAEDIQRRWLEPLASLLRAGGLESVDLYPGDGRRYHLTGAHMRRWWRRRAPSAKAAREGT